MIEEVGEERRQRPRGGLPRRTEQRAHQPRDGLVGPLGAQHRQQVTARVGAAPGRQRAQEDAQFGTPAPGGAESRTAPAVHARGLLVRQPERGDDRRGGQPVAELGHQVGLFTRGQPPGEDMGAAFDGGGQRGRRGPAQRPFEALIGLRRLFTGQGDEPGVGERGADVVVAADEPGAEGLVVHQGVVRTERAVERIRVPYGRPQARRGRWAGRGACGPRDEDVRETQHRRPLPWSSLRRTPPRGRAAGRPRQAHTRLSPADHRPERGAAPVRPFG